MSPVDTLYGVGSAVRGIERAYPQDRVLAAAACKGLRRERPLEVGRGLHWGAARRAPLVITDRRLACKDWVIPAEDVETATYRTFVGILSKGMILEVVTRDGVQFLFGVNRGPDWLEGLPFPLREELMKANMTLIWIVRLGLLAWLANLWM